MTQGQLDERPMYDHGSAVQTMIRFWACLFTVALCVFYWTIGPLHFADFAQYVGITQDLAADASSWPLWGPEGLSRGLLRFSYRLTGGAAAGVQAIALVTQLLMISAVFWAARQPHIQAQNLFLAVALFAPLLALITLRNTPAYLLCIAAVTAARRANRSKLGSVALTGGASIFLHGSAVYVLGAALGAVLIPGSVSRKTLFTIGIAAGAFGLFLRRAVDIASIGGVVLNWVGPFGSFVADRLVYLSNSGDPVGGLHIAYFCFVAFTVYRLVMLAPKHSSDRLVLVMFILYGILTLSPVVGIRVSHFMIIPLLVSASRSVVSLGSGVLAGATWSLGCVALLTASLFTVMLTR